MQTTFHRFCRRRPDTDDTIPRDALMASVNGHNVTLAYKPSFEGCFPWTVRCYKLDYDHGFKTFREAVAAFRAVHEHASNA